MFLIFVKKMSIFGHCDVSCSPKRSLFLFQIVSIVQTLSLFFRNIYFKIFLYQISSSYIIGMFITLPSTPHNHKKNQNKAMPHFGSFLFSQFINYNFIATSHAPQITVRRFPTFLQSPTSGALPLFASGAGR